MTQRYQMLRVPDGTLLKLASALIKKDLEAIASFEVADGISLSLKSGEPLPREWSKAIGSSTYFVSSAVIHLENCGFTLRFYRAQRYKQDPSYGDRWVPSDQPFIDGVEFSGPSEKDARIEILATINQFLSLAPPAELSARGGDALDQSSSILNRVSEAVATLTEHAAERQIELDKARDRLEKEAREEIRQYKNDLDLKAEQEFQRVAEIEDELKARASALDDRENTHVRRQLQERMVEVATTNLDKELLNKSNAIFQQTRIYAIFFAILILAIAAYQSIELARQPADQIRDVIIFNEVRIVLLGLAAGALILYALRLSSSRFRQIAKWENDLNRFRLDVERASFLVEGDLEARKHGESGLPDVMLQRFSQGLFASGHSDSASDQDDVGSALSHILSRAASVKIGTDGMSVEVDKSGIRKARRDIAKEASEEG
jgi:hypothetical protein